MKPQKTRWHTLRTAWFYILIYSVVAAFTGCASAVRFSSRADAATGTEHTSKTGLIPPAKQSDSAVKLFPDDSPNLTEKQREILAKAKQFLGLSYCYGGNGPQCIDCSGFVSQVFAATGIILPRTAHQQSFSGSAINPNDAVPGDLLFFSFDNRTVEHVGIYAGNRSIIHASKTKGVVLQRLDASGLLSGLHSIRRIAGVM